MKTIKLTILSAILLLASFQPLAYATLAETSIESKIEGKWFTPKWNYGFRIEGMSGYVTKWNYKYNPEDKTKVGDVVLHIKEYTPTGFLAEQKFFNGKLVPVVGTLIEPNTIKLEAGPEVWKMLRSE